ncbi:DNA-binding protein [Variovorax sp. Sphag1AA]|uniref:DNA-binding protein n=1 Tax=Variovorax sp. Sphag1AA TaxID=2587027 RepID=UPI00161BE108|nr:DNA-binding protein [Variovorax sp. Sphag1AA]MBB3178427.1 chromosome segregation ATPase [Variovorax sp. Sphag1AA]
MSQLIESRSRGIQEADVFAAADALLADGKRPTIERVRQQIGRGSPNTVSPMLERWFATLGGRLVGSPGTRTAGNDLDGMPLGVRNAAKLLWETAQKEAEETQRGELATVRSELQAREDSLAEAQGALAQREDAFKQARVSLDAALSSSQQARETLEGQLKAQAIETQRVRTGLEDEVRRLTALLSQTVEAQEQMRREHAAVVAAKDQDLRHAQERHSSQEKRMLAEVDRARQAAKALEAELAKEHQKRTKGEEAAAKRLDAAAEKLQQVRDQLAAQAIELAQERVAAAVQKDRAEALQQRIDEERGAHDATRRLLSEALARSQKSGGQARARATQAKPRRGAG